MDDMIARLDEHKPVNILHLIFRCFVKRRKKIHKRKKEDEKRQGYIMSWFSLEENFWIVKIKVFSFICYFFVVKNL